QLSGKKITALVVSVLFALHPMHVESVAWVSERKDVLYTMFFLLSMIAYLRYMKSGYQKKKYIGVILYFIASLLSKSAAVTLPVILIAIDLYKGRKINIRSLLEKAPLFLLSLLFGILAILSQKSDGALKDLSLSYTIINQIFIFSYNIAFYIVKLIAPLNLSTMYYYPVIHGNALPVLYYFSLPLLLIISWFIYRKISFRKESIFGVSFFLIALSVMLQIIPVGISFASDRYTYVASIGLFFIAGQWVSNIQKKHIKNAVVALFSIYTIMISYQTWARIGYWKNAEILFTDVIKKYPDNYHGYWVRGIYRNEINDLQGALQDFNKVMEYNPNRADNAIARGSIRYKLNDFKGAWEDADFTIKLDSTIAEAYNNRGIAYEGLGDMKSAFLDYNKAILLKPAYGMAYDNRGVIKAKSGDMVGAIEDINKAIKLSPEDSKAYSDRGNIKAMQKDYKGSVEDFNIALKLKPDDKIAYYNRGNSRYNLNDKTGACEDWKKSNELGYEMAADALSKFCN
ncbi:MAG: tetratricopeptide repeat protein, partial [Bacteroidetes bacterium]|nr:tetratricopeptide repeat protein [Bacteroidota bacterium]